MAKFYGIIGYTDSIETAPGVWTDGYTECNYSGDVLKITRRWQAGEGVNDDLTIDNKISIVADPFAYQNFHKMKYIEWMGSLWKIINVEVQRPRLILTIGGIYNGPSSRVTNTP